jgi:hypothetical protein
MYIKISGDDERIVKAIAKTAFLIHKGSGPAITEKVYEDCFAHELTK